MAIGRGNCTDEQRWVGSRGLAGFLWRTNDTELREKRRKKVFWDTNSEELWTSVSLAYFFLVVLDGIRDSISTQRICNAIIHFKELPFGAGFAVPLDARWWKG